MRRKRDGAGTNASADFDSVSAFFTEKCLGRRGAVAPLWASLAAAVGLGVGCVTVPRAKVADVERSASGQGSNDEYLLHGEKVSDPYQWLEEANSPRTQKWVEQQSAQARKALDATGSVASVRSRFVELLDRNADSVPVQRGQRLFFTRRIEGVEKAVLVVRDSGGAERIVIDPNVLSDSSPEGSVTLGVWVPSPDGSKLAYSLHVNNADEATLYVLDMASGRTLPQDTIDGAKYAGPSWTPDSSAFYYEWLPTDSEIGVAERPGYTEIRYHALGEPSAQDPVVFPATRDPETFLNIQVSDDGNWLILGVQTGWSNSDIFVRSTRTPWKPPLDAMVQSVREARGSGVQRALGYAEALGFSPLAVGLDANFRVRWFEGHFYLHTNYQAPNYQVIRVAGDELSRENWQTVVAASEATLEEVELVGGQLVLSYLQNASSQLQVRALDGSGQRIVPLPGLGSVGVVRGRPESTDVYFSYSSFAVPSQVQRLQLPSIEPSVWFQPDVALGKQDIEVSQVWYASKDGTQVSMFLVHSRGLSLDGNHPTLLYGYGGFNVSITPSFSSLATVWIERGGVYAVPNLRGGGEYGEQWHRAGMGANKQNVFDDYLAAAEYLIDKKFTRPERLGIYGRSNGGLLVGAAMTQRPDLFGAVVCGVPLLDMLRYHLFGSGRTWIPEYGSAEDETQFNTLRAYSPYHHLKPGVSYPPLLMLAADSDDRVDPMHARKFVASLQGLPGVRAQDALFRLETNAGHGGGGTISQAVSSNADLVAFLTERLGLGEGERPSEGGVQAAEP